MYNSVSILIHDYSIIIVCVFFQKYAANKYVQVLCIPKENRLDLKIILMLLFKLTFLNMKYNYYFHIICLKMPLLKSHHFISCIY